MQRVDFNFVLPIHSFSFQVIFYETHKHYVSRDIIIEHKLVKENQLLFKR